jgi:hypothetical protein
VETVLGKTCPQCKKGGVFDIGGTQQGGRKVLPGIQRCEDCNHHFDPNFRPIGRNKIYE